MANNIPILTYHRVHADEDITPPNDLGRVDRSVFRRQMQYLAESNLRVVTHRELAAWLYDGRDIPERAVAIDFDDNRLNVFENAFPLMRELGFPATVFTVTDLADNSPHIGNRMDVYPWMTWDHLKQLHDTGWCIAPHTVTHPWLAGPDRTISDDDVQRELAESRRLVEQRLGFDAPYFAYPAGYWDEHVESMVKTLFKTARHWQLESTSDWPTVSRDCDPYRLFGINIAMNTSWDTFRSIVDAAV